MVGAHASGIWDVEDRIIVMELLSCFLEIWLTLRPMVEVSQPLASRSMVSSSFSSVWEINTNVSQILLQVSVYGNAFHPKISIVKNTSSLDSLAIVLKNIPRS